MPLRNLLKRKRPDDAHTSDESHDAEGSQRSRMGLSDHATRERRRNRLERRIKDLTFDIEKAETALAEQNRWSERVSEINLAIEQAQSDAREIVQPANPFPLVALDAIPIAIEQVEPGRTTTTGFDIVEDLDPGDPADIRFSIGPVGFRYTDDIDWSERGHNRSEAQLRRVAGDIEQLIGADIPADRVVALHEHLAHSISTYAEALQTNALEGRPQPSLTLSDLAEPCPVCGNWRDWKGRCPSCQRRQWEAQDIHAEIDRLMDERNQQLDEAQSWRDRLPILRRQLEEARKELTKYID